MTAVAYRFRAELRRRAVAWVGVGVVIGLAGGLVVALLAGARRTDTAYDRFLASHAAADAVLISGVPGVFDFAPIDLDAVAAMPDVADSALLRIFGVAGRTPDGTLVSSDSISFAGDTSGRLGTEVNRFKVLDGRLADPGEPNEVVANFPAAEELSLSVGDVLRTNFLDGAELGALFGGVAGFEALAGTGPFEELEVVGIVAVPGDFPPPADPTGDIEFVYVTPAFAEAYAGTEAVRALAVRLDGGSAAVGPFLGRLQAESGDLPVAGTAGEEQAEAVRRALGPLSRALLIGGALAAVVATLVLGQLLARQAFTESADRRTLDGLGFTGREHQRLRLLKGVLVGAVAALVAVGAAVLLSPLFPIGLARTAEPDPGVDVDTPVVVLGAAGVLLVTVVVTGVAGWLSDRWHRPATAREASPGRAPGGAAVARRLGSAAPGPVAMAGTTLAANQRGTASAVVGIGLGLLTVVGILTFAASLDRLRDTPALYGWTWDVMVGSDFGEPLDADGIERIAADPAVRGMEVGVFVDVDVGGHRVSALAVEPVAGDVVPAVIDGRPPQGADEIVVAADVAPELDVGDRVRLTLGDRSLEVDVVGRASLPEVDVLADFRSVRQLSSDSTPQLAVVELAPGTDVADFGERATAGLGIAGTNVERPRLPQDLANFGRADATPAVIGALMGLVAAATLLHALLTAVQRGRRTLAVLRTIGFTARQLLSVVAWQATVLVAVSFVVALPLGIVAGRRVWLAFAESLGVVPEAAVPVGALAVTAAAALLVAVLVGGFPGWRAGRVSPAGVLRGD